MKLSEFAELTASTSHRKPLIWNGITVGTNVYPTSLRTQSLKNLMKFDQNISTLAGVDIFHLRVISNELCYYNKMTAKIFKLFTEGAPRELWIKDGSKIDFQSFFDTITSMDTSALEVLKLDLCSGNLCDDVVMILWKKPLNLRSLSIRKAIGLSEVGIIKVINNSHSLVSLNLGGCVISVYTINHIAEVLGPTLSKFYLDECEFTDITALSCLKNFRNLSLISLFNLSQLSDQILVDIISTNGKQLTTLNISECALLTQTAIRTVAQFCSGLRELNASLTYLTDLSLAYLAIGCRNIRSLDISDHYYGLSDQAIAVFIETAGEFLFSINLHGNFNVGYHIADAIARTCVHLKYLDVSDCKKLVDRDVGIIADRCGFLEVLKIELCDKITEKFVQAYSNPRRLIVDFSRMLRERRTVQVYLTATADGE